MGGVFGLVVAIGGCVEYQGNDDPHFHGNLHKASVYQHKTLVEIAAMMEKNILNLQNITDYQEWICREDHFNLEQHNSRLDLLEQRWHENNSTAECHDLCQLPSYILHDSTQTLWSEDNAYDVDEAFADGAVFKRKYFADAQHFFSHCHHHWHPKGPRTGERRPIRGCRSKKGHQCKSRFPHLKRLNLVPKIVCPGNARKHDLRVSGRRNALGSILSTRRCSWFSGTAPPFAVIFRHNTHGPKL